MLAWMSAIATARQVCWAADSEQAQSRLTWARAVPRDRCDLDHTVVAWPGVASRPCRARAAPYRPLRAPDQTLAGCRSPGKNGTAVMRLACKNLACWNPSRGHTSVMSHTGHGGVVALRCCQTDPTIRVTTSVIPAKTGTAATRPPQSDTSTDRFGPSLSTSRAKASRARPASSLFAWPGR